MVVSYGAERPFQVAKSVEGGRNGTEREEGKERLSSLDRRGLGR